MCDVIEFSQTKPLKTIPKEAYVNLLSNTTKKECEKAISASKYNFGTFTNRDVSINADGGVVLAAKSCTAINDLAISAPNVTTFVKDFKYHGDPIGTMAQMKNASSNLLSGCPAGVVKLTDLIPVNASADPTSYLLVKDASKGVDSVDKCNTYCTQNLCDYAIYIKGGDFKYNNTTFNKDQCYVYGHKNPQDPPTLPFFESATKDEDIYSYYAAKKSK